jgi:hypothetical protein
VSITKLQYLDSRLKNILDGKTFDDWCEDTIDSIASNDIPITFTNFFIHRNISNVKVNESLIYPARLIKESNSFYIEIKSNVHWDNDKTLRNIIAHEIGHTFQYSINENNITDLANFSPGTSEAELFSNRIARSIILPRKLILDYESKYTAPNKRSIKLFYEIAKVFNTKISDVIIRFIVDFANLNNLMYLKFVKVSENKWLLIEQYRPASYNTVKYFIATKRNNGPYPSCGQRLNDFLDTVESNYNLNVEFEFDLKESDINEKPLNTFMKNFKGYTFYNTIGLKNTYENLISLNFLLTLKER